jgi:outer membrane protein OmpA-like peptidoglycan-associated protein
MVIMAALLLLWKSTVLAGVAAGIGVFSIAGCKAHGGAGGHVALGGEASANAEGNVEGSATGEGEARAGAASEAAPKKKPKPIVVSPVRFCGGELEYEGTIDFAYNSDRLEGEGTVKALRNLRDFLQKNPGIKIQVEGHTDSRGSADYNRALSKRRAASVRAWLIDNGIDKDRVSSVGYGEDKPKVQEPPECNNKVPADKSTCEEAWATNRRSVFRVVEGRESMKEQCGHGPEPEPEPEPAPAPPKPVEREPEPEPCPTDLVGLHLNALGPNSWISAEGAWQPLCWLELSGGLGYKQGDVDASVPEGTASGSYKVLTVPARGRIWFFRHFSPVVDLGLGISRYTIEASSRAPNGQVVDYSFAPWRFIAFGGVGLGYRTDGPFRIAGLVGGMAHTKNLRPFYSLSDAKLYGEVSLGFLF